MSDDEPVGIDPARRAAELRAQLDLRGALNPRVLNSEVSRDVDVNARTRSMLIEAYQRLAKVEDPFRLVYQRLELYAEFLIPWAFDAPFEIELLCANRPLDLRVDSLETALLYVREPMMRDKRMVLSVKARLDQTFRQNLVDQIEGLLPTQGDAPKRLASWWSRIEGRYDGLAKGDPAANEDVIESRVRDLRHELESVIEEAESARDAAQRAAGLGADYSLSQSFHYFAQRDSLIGGMLSFGSVATLSGGGAAGVWVLSNTTDLTWQLVLSKAAVGIPILAVSAYLGRLSSHYRTASRWAKTARVQLATIDGFVRGFSDPNHGDIVRLELGRRVYGPQADAEESSTTTVEMSEITALIQAIGDASKRG